MKSIKIVALFAIVLLALWSCKTPKNAATTGAGSGEISNFQDTVSYVLGVDIGTNFKKNMIELNWDLFAQGMQDGLAGNDSTFDRKLMDQVMARFQAELNQKMEEVRMKEAEANKVKAAAFLAENKNKEGVFETASGLQYRIIKDGSGTPPKATDEVTVHYEGKLLDGSIFDSSYERKQTATFNLSGVIKGWTEALQLMKPGSTYELFIPPDLAYGDRGNRGIPGGSLLIFKVELISVQSK